MITKNYVVYCHTNKINGKRYVGITSQQPERRWNNGKGYKASSRFYSAIKHYGWENFSHEILYTGLTEKEAIKKEKYLISKWKLTNKKFGYNMTAGGEYHSYVGRKLSEETKRKIGMSHMGKRPSEDTLIKLRQSHINKGGIPVAMYDKDKLIGVFITPAEAQRMTKINSSHINECCRLKRKSAGGYFWKYVL